MSAAPLTPLSLAPLLGAYVRIGPDKLGASTRTFEGTLTAVEYEFIDPASQPPGLINPALLVYLIVPTTNDGPARSIAVPVRRASQIRHVYRKATP